MIYKPYTSIKIQFESSVNELALFMCFELLLDCLAEVIGKTFGRDICSPEPRKLPNHRNAWEANDTHAKPVLCPTLNQPWNKNFVHHHEVVCINVEHWLYVLARRLVEALQCERARRRDHQTDVQILHLLGELMEIIRG